MFLVKKEPFTWCDSKRDKFYDEVTMIKLTTEAFNPDATVGFQYYQKSDAISKVGRFWS